MQEAVTTPKMPSKLEQLQRQYRRQLLQEKEERMIKIHTESQQKALSKVIGQPSLPPAPHHSPVKKGSPGVDRSRPLPPITHSRTSPVTDVNKVVANTSSRSKAVSQSRQSPPKVLQNNGYVAKAERSQPDPDALARLKQTKSQNGTPPRIQSKKPPAAKQTPPPISHQRGTAVPGSRKPPPGSGQEQCAVCGRNFNSDRIEKHSSICSKAAQKKVKVFDATKMRVKGTEAEQFVKRGVAKAEPVKAKKSDWRKQHNEFIEAIRQAKIVQQHLAKGGKVSDLPPPPPSDHSDYVPCQYCGRKFSPGVADRHIPKCKTILSNKKKPAPSRRK